MLTQLSIQNIVLIEQCRIEFGGGLVALTGETGAGKSILLDALGLALGLRAESGLVRAGAAQGSVSAAFDIGEYLPAQRVLNELGLEVSNEAILRRAVTAEGKSRAFINDQPVSVSGLRALGETLVEIHGQHDQRGLLDSATHIAVLDSFGGLAAQVKRVVDAFAAWRQAQEELATLRQAIEQAKAEEDYLRFTASELNTLAPQAGEEESLADARARMMRSEKVAQMLQQISAELAGEADVSARLRSAHRMLSRSSLSGEGGFDQAATALDTASEAVDAALAALEALGESYRYDESELERMEERLFALRACARKHQTTVDGLAAIAAETAEKLSRLEKREEALGTCEKAEVRTKEAYVAAAQELSEARHKAAAKLEKATMAELKPLKMEGTVFKVVCEPLPEPAWGSRGIDQVRFEAATNKGASLAPLHKIASGGELSRFMLALKVAMRAVAGAPVLIFDEIDAGTGGAVADAIGRRLAALGEAAQVLVVTHLPQVAARAGQHLRVYKKQGRQHTQTFVEPISDSGREEEVARMLAGAEITGEARRAAAKLLEGAA